MTVRILVGDALATLKTLPDQSVQCCVTSPPYWGLRDYGVEGQLGQEPTLDAYVAALVGVFAEVHRVLRADATLWINLGDVYAGSWGARGRGTATNSPRADLEKKYGTTAPARHGIPALGIKTKDLIGLPWRVAFALQAAGWYLRSDIIWAKPNPMPESVTDRPTKAHEYIFLLSKSEQYFYDAQAIAEPLADSSVTRLAQPTFDQQTGGPKDYGPNSNRSARKALVNLKARANKQGATGNRQYTGFHARWDVATHGLTRNSRTVWTIPTAHFKGAHFATFPPALAERCILAGCPAGGVVLDPFAGAGTAGLVAERLGRDSVLIELNANYAEIARSRIVADSPLFSVVA